MILKQFFHLVSKNDNARTVRANEQYLAETLSQLSVLTEASSFLACGAEIAKVPVAFAPVKEGCIFSCSLRVCSYSHRSHTFSSIRCFLPQQPSPHGHSKNILLTVPGRSNKNKLYFDRTSTSCTSNIGVALTIFLVFAL